MKRARDILLAAGAALVIGTWAAAGCQSSAARPCMDRPCAPADCCAGQGPAAPPPPPSSA